VFRHRVEVGEELEIIPSHLFYLSGCDLLCCFCIAEAKAFDPSIGTKLTAEFLSDAIAHGRKRGARNIQWVGGEPTVHLPAILQAMSGCADLPPVVWKSDFYGTRDAFALLRGVVSTYVADFKFGNDTCAKNLANVDRYVATITRNLSIVAHKDNLIVRHLLLPGHFECCFRPIVEHLVTDLPGAKFSVRDGYLPRWKASHYGALGQPLDPEVAACARELARSRGINVVQ
jgi:putative pyruvate formate lyase activating enzyme